MAELGVRNWHLLLSRNEYIHKNMATVGFSYLCYFPCCPGYHHQHLFYQIFKCNRKEGYSGNSELTLLYAKLVEICFKSLSFGIFHILTAALCHYGSLMQPSNICLWSTFLNSLQLFSFSCLVWSSPLFFLFSWQFLLRRLKREDFQVDRECKDKIFHWILLYTLHVHCQASLSTELDYCWLFVSSCTL